ncbi:MAG: PilZ domain-containing protein [Desulfuromonadales bacterium]|nr:MAG: PilZ domain-containing protein [Desulfuromonadales bacterium]
MTEEISTYQKHFSYGLRVEVRIPRPNEGPFRDGAVISRFEEDLVELQLSRDVLPASARVETGTTIDIRTGKDGSAYCCRALIVSERQGAYLTTRLIGDVMPDEMRDFYRIDTYIPIFYQLPGDESPELVREQLQQQRSASQKPANHAVPLQVCAGEATNPVPLAANLSGSGIRIRIHEELRPGSLIPLELHLRQIPPRTISTVGKVVHVNQLRTSEGAPLLYSTALRFLCIDKRDQEAVATFVAAEQREHLRTMRGGPSGFSCIGFTGVDSRGKPQRFAVTAAIILILAAIVTALVYSRLTGTKGEIEETYEREIGKYRKLFPWR